MASQGFNIYPHGPNAALCEELWAALFRHEGEEQEHLLLLDIEYGVPLGTHDGVTDIEYIETELLPEVQREGILL